MKKTSQVYSRDWQLPEYELYRFKPKKTRYCICIPVLNEGEKIKKQLKKMKKYTDLADIIICDWGSSDGSTAPEFLKNNGVSTLLVKKSWGWQATQLRMGFAYAMKQGYEGIIQIDGNGKDGVEAIPNFIKSLDEGFDYIQGSRFIKGGKAINTPLLRWLGIRFITSPILSASAGYWYTDVTNGFRAYSKNYLLHPGVKPFRNKFERYSLNFYLCVRASQLGLKTKELPVLRKYPKGKIPTKMTRFRNQLTLLEEVIRTALNYYHP